VVEGARLESVYRGDSIVGSNPTVSATLFIPNCPFMSFKPPPSCGLASLHHLQRFLDVPYNPARDVGKSVGIGV
jgi:hypothetical protein